MQKIACILYVIYLFIHVVGGDYVTKAKFRLLLQFPWESAGSLTSEQITGEVIPHLLAMAGRLGQDPSSGVEVGSDDAELATLIAKVCLFCPVRLRLHDF